MPCSFIAAICDFVKPILSNLPDCRDDFPVPAISGKETSHNAIIAKDDDGKLRRRPLVFEAQSGVF